VGYDYATALAVIRSGVYVLLAEIDALDEPHAVAIAAADAADAEDPTYHAAIAGLLWGITEVPGLAISMSAVFADLAHSLDLHPVVGRLSREDRGHVIYAAQRVVAAILYAPWLRPADQRVLRSAWEGHAPRGASR
jgi:hypothetical protein